MSEPIAIDLFCGLGGWTEGLLAEGYYVVGFDIERHDYGDEKYPAQLVLQDVRTIHGRQFRKADLIVGSSPCQEFSYRAMPWKRAKALGPPVLGIELFEAQFRIQREACEAAGRHIPLVVENVRGAQKYVGRSRWSYGSFHLWGDVPALMPMSSARKNSGGSWFGVAHNTTSGTGRNPDGRKGGAYMHQRDGHGHTRHMTNPAENGRDGHRCAMRQDPRDGIKNGKDWFDSESPSLQRRYGSKSVGRKRATAMIAKIPLALSRHIAAVYHPRNSVAA